MESSSSGSYDSAISTCPSFSEGVETDAERATLVRLGVDLLQGYWLGRPRRELLCA